MDNTIAIEIDGVEIGAVISNERKRPLLTVKIPNDDRVFKIGLFDSERDAFWFFSTLSKMYRNVKADGKDEAE